MTSRTTKQAARAYQKAHDVPYSEALRRVMQPEEPNLKGGVGRVGKGKSAASAKGPVAGFTKHTTSPVHFDLLDYENSGGGHSTADPVVLNLGTGILGNTGFHPHSVPATWSPARTVAEDRPATLGVYGRGGEGKSVYLSTLARNHLVGVPTLVVAAFPQHFPEQEGMTFLDSRVVRNAMYSDGDRSEADRENLYAFEEVLTAAIVDGAPQVIICDDCPEGPLNRLIRRSRSQGVAILFSSLNVEEVRTDGTDRVFQPGSRVLSPEVTVMLNPVGARHPRGGAWGGSYEQSWVRKHGYDPMPLIRPTP